MKTKFNFLITTFAILLLLFSHSVVSNSFWPHGLQDARLPCASLSPGACSNSCPLSWWCHPTISSSVTSFSSCLQCFPVSGSFPRSRLFSNGQSIGASASASVLPSFYYNYYFTILLLSMLLRLFIPITPVWWKYYILVYYCISSQHCVQFCNVGGTKLATVGVVTTWKLANTTKLGLFIV